MLRRDSWLLPILEDYNNKRLVYEGDSKRIFIAESTEDKRQYIYKRWNEKIRNQNQQNKILKLLKPLTNLSHPNLAKYHEISFESDGILRMVLEVLEGQTLQTILESRSSRLADPAYSLEILSQTSKAISYLHEEGIQIINLDPSNIFITIEGRVKLLNYGFDQCFIDVAACVPPKRSPWDFFLCKGHSKSTHSIQQQKIVLNPQGPSGKYYYQLSAFTPPEFTRTKKAGYTLEGDLYAFGCVAYYIGNKKAPFEVDDNEKKERIIKNLQQLKDQNAYEKFQANGDFGQFLQKLVKGLVLASPRQRIKIQKVKELIKEMEANFAKEKEEVDLETSNHLANFKFDDVNEEKPKIDVNERNKIRSIRLPSQSVNI